MFGCDIMSNNIRVAFIELEAFGNKKRKPMREVIPEKRLVLRKSPEKMGIKDISGMHT